MWAASSNRTRRSNHSRRKISCAAAISGFSLYLLILLVFAVSQPIATQVPMDEDLNRYDLYHITTAHPKMTDAELLDYYRGQLLRRFETPATITNFAVSPDGRYVAFASMATNLGGAPTGSDGRVALICSHTW